MRLKSHSATTVLAIVVLTAMMVSACGGGGGVAGPGATQHAFPAVGTQTSESQETPGGQLAQDIDLDDATSGGGLAIPAGTFAQTSHEQFDTNGDGMAEIFAASILPLQQAAAASSTGSRGGNTEGETLHFVGGVCFAPVDAKFSQPVNLVVPAAATVAAGTAVDVWRFVDARTASQLGNQYWFLVGRSVVEIQGGHPVARISARRFGNYALSISTAINHSPAITWLTANPYSVVAGAPSQLTCAAVDTDLDALSYSWSGGGVFDDPTRQSTAWRSDTPGNYSIQCTVSDGRGGTASRSLNLQVQAQPAPNLAPTIDSLSAEPAQVGLGADTALTCLATDPEGETLTYSWAGSGTFGTLDQAQTTWHSDTPGTFDLSCTVADPHGLQAASVVNVEVVAPNQNPVIDTLTAEPLQITTAGSCALTCVATDPDADTLTCSWSGGGVFADATMATTAWSSSTTGNFTLVCNVEDGRGGTATDSVDVEVVGPPDTQAPQWGGGDPAFTAVGREGDCALYFNQATDDSGEVVYSIYAGETATFDLATAEHYSLTFYPNQPYVSVGREMAKSYTFALQAEDRADPPNATTVYYATATPQPYYDDVPAGGHAVGTTGSYSDMALRPGSDRGLVLVWANDAGALCFDHVPDAQAFANPDANWVLDNVDSGMGIPRVFFRGSLPVIVCADQVGAVWVFMQQLTGDWTRTQIFSRPGTVHVALGVEYDPAADTFYMGHVTESPGPPVTQTVHFMVVGLDTGTPVVADQADDAYTADYIAQVYARIDTGGTPWLIYSAGTASLEFPPIFEMQLYFVPYTPGSDMSTPQTSELVNPMYFDIQPDAAGWKLLVTDAEPVTMGSTTVLWNMLRLAVGTVDNWGTPTTVYSGTASQVGGVATYDFPFECALTLGSDLLYFNRGAGEMDSQDMMSTATLSLWSSLAGAAPVKEPGNSLSRLRSLAAPGGNFVFGAEIPSFDAQSVTDQLDLPGGYMVLREVP